MIYQYFGEINYPSYSALLFGGAHFIAGGFLEGCIWFANPLLIFGLFLLFKKNDKSIFPLIISSFLAFTFLFFENLTMTKSGRIAPITELKSGYFLWLFSILFATFYSIFIKIKKWKTSSTY
ncbi:hypothetical protein [Chryseobacterium luquanense]|uniref:Uncharacterized protein n=1 Tax=Chryseobacterium luquanense TaxID=2983766 RepID=A0ABT3Y886_9FLAO|nr:hypothetical protein [Chryseobacterium luquanense]MCX8534390.1 hypothetical protein [Chryseobacterium luquanense]